VAIAALVLIAGLVYAQESKPVPPTAPEAGCPINKEVRKEVRMGPGGMGMGMGMMMPDMPVEVRRKVHEQRMKSFPEVAKLRTDVAYKHMEMRGLWLEDEPNLDKIVAKMKEIAKLELDLKEKQLNNWFEIYKVMPKELRKDFMQRGCPGMGEGMCPGMGSGMGRGMGMGRGQRRMVIKQFENQVEGSDGDCLGCPTEE
jgi:Spy/CpxP family protein refolding chaperone